MKWVNLSLTTWGNQENLDFEDYVFIFSLLLFLSFRFLAPATLTDKVIPRPFDENYVNFQGSSVERDVDFA